MSLDLVNSRHNTGGFDDKVGDADMFDLHTRLI